MEQKPGSFIISVDGETVRQVKDIIGRFVHTVAAMRLYPFGHINVTKFRDNLFQRLSSYLEEQGEFEIEIKESSFTFAGIVVFQEESGIKSLPYLYYNEGMRALTFIPGLTREELYDFLEITATYAERSGGGSDFIEELWERDFEFIRYDAAEGFLEAKVAAGLESRPLEMQIDRELLFSGRISLDSEDQAAAHARSIEVTRTSVKDAADLADFFGVIDRSDQSSLDSMVTAEHDLSSDREFIETVFEVLYLEDRMGSFLEILGNLKAYLKTLFKRADLGNAVLMLNSITDLQRALRSSSPARSEALLEMIRDITRTVDLTVIAEIARPERVEDPRTLYEFLALMGPGVLKIGTDVFEYADEPAWREAGIEYLRVMVQNSPNETFATAQNRKPELTKTLITLLGERDDKKSVAQLATFAKSENSEIRLEAVRTLGTLSHDLARKLILEYLNDPDERIRVEAARAARLDSDERNLAQMLELVQSKAFLARSSAERGTLLLAIGRSNAAEAAKALKALVRKRRLFGGGRLQETRLLAVAALAAMKIPEAQEALTEGSRVSNQAVATACAQALRKRGERHREDA